MYLQEVLNLFWSFQVVEATPHPAVLTMATTEIRSTSSGYVYRIYLVKTKTFVNPSYVMSMSRELNAKCCVVRSLVWLLDSSNLIVFSSDFFLARMPHSDYNSWSAAGCDGTGHHRTRGMQPGPWRGRSYARLARHAFRTPDTLGLSSSSRVIFDDLIC